MIKRVMGIDQRERVIIPLSTLENWCRIYHQRQGIDLPKDFIVELVASETTVIRFENKTQDKKLEEKC